MILSIYKVKEPQIGQYGPAKDFVMRSIWHILHGDASLRDLCKDGLEKVQPGIYAETGEGSSRMTTFAADAKKWIIEKKRSNSWWMCRLRISP